MTRQVRLLPPLPPLRELVRELREVHAAFAHPEGGAAHVGLAVEGRGWRVTADPSEAHYGWEPVPGNGERFDAVRCARRLLFAVEDNAKDAF